MKIKTKKKMRLDELIEYKKNGTKRDIYEVFKCDDGLFEVRMSGSCLDYVRRNGFGHQNELPNMPFHTLFTVEVEEELTEDTELERITIFFYDTQTKNNGFGTYRDLSIHEALEMNKGTLKFISMVVDDVLIWSRDSGIPESGVLEVDDE